MSLLFSSIILFGCKKKKEEKEKSHTLIFHTNTNTQVSSVTKINSDLINYNLPVIERDGYSFNGWYFDNEFTIKYSTELLEEGINELYAKFDLNQYSIVIHDDLEKKYVFNYGDEIIINDLEKDNQIFLGYYTESSLINEFDLKYMPSHNIDLYPKFRDYYDIKVEVNLEKSVTLTGGDLNQKVKNAKEFSNIDIESNYGYNYLYYEINGVKYSNDIISIPNIDDDIKISIVCEYATYELPIININTDNKPISNKVDYVDMDFSMINCNDELEEVTGGIRLRGNSTMYQPKKPYRLKFDKKQSLFGLEKAKFWVLLADYLDPSCLHNYTALSLGNELDGLNFTPTPNKVNLYLNGEYQGLYTLCEQIQENKGRINIEKAITEDMVHLKDYNFFISMDYSVASDSEAVLDETYFYLEDYGQYIELKYPEKGDFPTDEQFNSFFTELKEYVKNLFDKFNSLDLDYISEEINISSLADYFIIDTIMMEKDHCYKSFNMYFTSTSKNNDENNKLNFGPIWDYDWCLDTPWTSEPNEYYDISNNFNYSNVFFQAIRDIPALYSIVKERYANSLSNKLNQFITDLAIYEDSIRKSLILNANKWYDTGYEITLNNIIFLNKHLFNRKKILDEAWLI